MKYLALLTLDRYLCAGNNVRFFFFFDRWLHSNELLPLTSILIGCNQYKLGNIPNYYHDFCNSRDNGDYDLSYSIPELSLCRFPLQASYNSLLLKMKITILQKRPFLWEGWPSRQIGSFKSSARDHGSRDSKKMFWTFLKSLTTFYMK